MYYKAVSAAVYRKDDIAVPQALTQPSTSRFKQYNHCIWEQNCKTDFNVYNKVSALYIRKHFAIAGNFVRDLMHTQFTGKRRHRRFLIDGVPRGRYVLTFLC